MDSVNLLRNRIHQLGHNNAWEFFCSHPMLPYGLLLKKVGIEIPGKNYYDIPIIALKTLHKNEAIIRGNYRDYAMDTLLRVLTEYIGKGWGHGKNSTKRRSNVYTYWSPPNDECEENYHNVWNELVRLGPPKDWRPLSVDDYYIQTAFENAWR